MWPLAVYSSIAVVIVVAMISISYFLGERHKERTTDDPYKSGAPACGSARRSLDVSYYLIAVFFVIFDLEAVFVFVWAVSLRELGWLGYIEIVIFIAFLLAGLIYLWLVGALDASTPRQRIDKAAIRR